MKRAVFAALVLFLGSFIGNSFGAEIILHENQYLRTDGDPNLYADTFPGIVGGGRLVVINGTVDGGKRVDQISSAVIMVNGVQILGPNSFGQNVHNIEAALNLNENNSISVELRSKPGSFIAIQVVQQMEEEGWGVIGSEGGKVKVTDPQSPLLGVGVHVLADTFPSGATIDISVQDQPPSMPLPEGFVQEGPCLSFESSNSNFQKSLFIKIPFMGEIQEDETRLVYTYNELKGEWELVIPLPALDPSIFMAKIGHFSDYVKGSALITNTTVETGFKIGVDTLMFENDGFDGTDGKPVDCANSLSLDNAGVCAGVGLLATEYFNYWADQKEAGLMCYWDKGTAAQASCDAFGLYTQLMGYDDLEQFWEVAKNEYWGDSWSSRFGLDYYYIISAVIENAKKNMVTPIFMMEEFRVPEKIIAKNSFGDENLVQTLLQNQIIDEFTANPDFVFFSSKESDGSLKKKLSEIGINNDQTKLILDIWENSTLPKRIGHTVVAYGWEKTNWLSGKIKIYNVNYNYIPQVITYAKFVVTQMAYTDPRGTQWKTFGLDPVVNDKSEFDLADIVNYYPQSEHPLNTLQDGVCAGSHQSCVNGQYVDDYSRISWYEPDSEVSCDNLDNDCDGLTDEDITRQCGTTDEGVCEYGLKICTAGIWGECEGNIEPIDEICDDNQDNNCDGQTDEECSSQPSIDGILGLWHLDNDWKDSISSNTSNPVNGVGFTAVSKIGSHAGEFDGIDDFVGSWDFRDAYNTFTIEFWAYPTGTRNSTPETTSGIYATIACTT